MNKVNLFWRKHKDTIKNGVIGALIPVTILSLLALKSVDNTIEDNNLEEIFYGKDDE